MGVFIAKILFDIFFFAKNNLKERTRGKIMQKRLIIYIVKLENNNKKNFFII